MIVWAKLMFNLFKCRHKRTYEVTTKMNDGSFVVNTYCRKCEDIVGFYTYMLDGKGDLIKMGMHE